jgi:hypothetical protein
MSKPNTELDKILEPVFKLGYEHSDTDYEELKQAIEQLIIDEKIALINLYGTPRCENLHHSKKDRHSALEDCPVVDRIKSLKELRDS